MLYVATEYIKLNTLVIYFTWKSSSSTSTNSIQRHGHHNRTYIYVWLYAVVISVQFSLIYRYGIICNYNDAAR